MHPILIYTYMRWKPTQKGSWRLSSAYFLSSSLSSKKIYIYLKGEAKLPESPFWCIKAICTGMKKPICCSQLGFVVAALDSQEPWGKPGDLLP